MYDTVEHPGEYSETEDGQDDKKTQPIPTLNVLTSRGRVLLLLSLRRNKQRQKQSNRLGVINITLLGILILGIIMPLGLSAGALIQGYQTLNTLGTSTFDGINQLEDLKTLLSTKNTGTTQTSNLQARFLDPARLKQASENLRKAHSDFQRTQIILNHTSWLQNAADVLPQTSSYLTTARAASQIGLDATMAGQDIVTAGTTLAPHLQGDLLGKGKTPLLTKSDIQMISTTIQQTLPLLQDIEIQAQQLSLGTLPISAAQRSQIEGYLALLPPAITALQTVSGMVDAFSWLIGVDQTRTFLVEPMDRAEIRATGGFTGQYGELKVTGGRVGDLSLENVALLEYTDNNATIGRLVPEQYRSWWPFANWGLRDANISPDFPTSAQYEMQLYQIEVGHKLDGVIQFTPLMIEHILAATGPVQVPRYGETVTAQNLEEKLHYYQLSHDGIVKEKQIEHISDDEQARKMFTSELTHILLSRIRKTSLSQLYALGQLILKDLQTRDVQVYVTNPQLEAFLARYNDAGAVDRNPQSDGLYIVQTNVSVNKATEFIKTHFTDNVTLDSNGNATHQLTMKFDYSHSGPIYGFDTYRDYLRIYVPPDAHLLSGSGFDSGNALCGGPLAACPQQHVYPHDQLSCPDGQYDGGAANQMLNDPFAGEDHPLDTLSGPTNTSSDLSGRAMFGGYVVIPKGCQITVNLTWSEHVQQPQHTYTLYVQRQAGTNPAFALSIQPAAYGNIPAQKQNFTSSMAKDEQYSVALKACTSC